ncbi:putative gEgh 16 protein [Mycena amicta]|nr:putative gEgh 16 protein [Mycena amicta]
MFFNTLLVLLAVCSSVRAHGTITGVTGANGVQAAGFGIIASTPRTGSSPKPFEQDTSIIRDREISSGKTGACGRTNAGGNNDVAAQLAAASQAGLPTTASDGSLTMTLHQVNQDGAGPYTCEVSTDGGNTFSAATVTQQVPGVFSLSLAKAQDFPLVAAVPAGTACAAGPNANACIMRCRNSALAGPFGSCVGFSMGNSTAAVAAPAASQAAAATSAAAVTGGAKQGGLAGLLAGLKSKLGRAENTPAKRYINSRVAGARSGYWM